LKFNSRLEIQFRDSFDKEKQLNDLDYREIRRLNIKSCFDRRCPRCRRRGYLNFHLYPLIVNYSLDTVKIHQGLQIYHYKLIYFILPNEQQQTQFC